MKNKRILMAYEASFYTCPRPKRIFNHYSKFNSVDVLSKDFNSPSEPNAHYLLCRISLSPFLRHLQNLCLYFGLVGLAWKIEAKKFFIEIPDLSQYDIIFVHNVHLLPFFDGYLHKVVFDAREFYPLQNSSSPQWLRHTGKIYSYLCEKYIKECKLNFTVSESIKDLYEKWLGIPFTLLRSCPDTSLPKIEAKDSLRPTISIVHHGAAIPNRNLEMLLELANELGEGYTLTLMLMPTHPEYLNKLKLLAKPLGNVKFIEPVPTDKIIETISQHDIGIHLMEQRGDQHEFALPNKFFEYIGAGLMLVVSGSVEMCKLVEQNNLGLAQRNFNSVNDIASQIKACSKKDIISFKKSSLAKRDKFTFKSEFSRIESLISNFEKI